MLWEQIILIIVFLTVIVFVVRPVHIFKGTRWQFLIDFASAPVIGVLFLLATTALTPADVRNGLKGDDNLQPYAILILFFSLSYVSVALDVTGAFAFIALEATKVAGTSGTRLFFVIYALAAVMTLVANNDIVVLTLTPIVCYFTQSLKLNPRPFLMAQFYAANLWSACFFIGDPTNIIAAQAYNLNFVTYLELSGLPTLVAGLSCILLTYLYYRNDIPVTFERPEVDSWSCLKDKFGAVFGGALVIGVMGLLVAASYSEQPVWYFTLPFAVISLAYDLIYDYRVSGKPQIQRIPSFLDAAMQVSPSNSMPGTEIPASDIQLTEANGSDQPHEEAPVKKRRESHALATVPGISHVVSLYEKFKARFPVTAEVLERQPWKVIPFVLSMFVIVQAFDSKEIVIFLAENITHVCTTQVATAFFFTFVSSLACNVLNNQPMTILFVRIILSDSFKVDDKIEKTALFATALGSNFGSNFTLIGALAGIMWSEILRRHHAPITYFEFAKSGFTIFPSVVALASLMLYLETLFLY